MTIETKRDWVRNYLGRIARTGRSKLKKIFIRTMPRVVEVDLLPGLRVRCDLKNGRQFFDFWFHEEDESCLQWIIDHLLPVGGTYVDVGANFGLFGLLAAYHRGAECLLFEPNPALVECIRRNVELSRMEDRVKVVPVAVSSQDGSADFYLDEKNDGRSSLSPEIRYSRVIRAELWRSGRIFDDGLARHIDLLKIDTEGHDLAVLQGLGAHLKPSNISMIYIELGGTPEERQAQADLLTAAGYTPYEAFNYFIDLLRKLEKKGEEFRMLRKMTVPASFGGSHSHLNYLWVEKESAMDRHLTRFCSRGMK